ncbi:MAG TPA: metal-dependent transcriptional regulator [Vicinamibacterales bacterium]|nr:metal-dependent transcriptional regulator [Vicinamibacterales bacterium]
MRPASQTVENYLKAILQAQSAAGDSQAVVSMGQLASALGVVPGTATTMVKALAESGLVHYEPYVGVRLTPAGEKLAALVLRRHRLIELFLVKVMGMSWAEVHDEAEQLEHAVSDRLIERIDEMLGHPEVDPHGDPIPGPGGQVAEPRYDTLLTCPMNAALAVARITDQDPEFLRFVEQNGLMPGQTIRVEGRDAAADRVEVAMPRTGGRVVLGTRAAAKVLVHALGVLLTVLVSVSTTARAQTRTVAPAQNPRTTPAASVRPPAEPFRILDNSFFIEEGFNQEPGIFQNIFGIVRARGGWEAAFTQEWPVGSERHQLSYTVPFGGAGGAGGLGDILVNYRVQALSEGPGRPAMAPRLSVILPTGDAADGLGYDTVGWQANLPVSKQIGDLYVHVNAGLTLFPRVSTGDGAEAARVSLLTPHAGGSLIWRTRPMLHVLVEMLYEGEAVITGPGRAAREHLLTISPGARAGRNVGDAQVVVGLAVPLMLGGADGGAGVFGYFSYERPFRRAAGTR